MKILIAILLGVLLMALGASGWRSNTGSGLFYLGGVIAGTGALLALSYRMNSSRQDAIVPHRSLLGYVVYLFRFVLDVFLRR